MHGRAEIHRSIAALRQLGGPYEGLQLVSSAEHIGIREGRRIRGRYQLRHADLITGRRFDDAIARCHFNIDVHSTNKKQGTAMEKSPPIQAYDIPLRCCLAKDIDGLMMAGRCISGDFYAHASYRVTGITARLGQASGCCAALAAQHNILPHEVRFAELQEHLAS